MNYRRVLERSFPVVEQTYSSRDVMLYALAAGLGQNPTDVRQLPFVYEQNLQVLPTMAVVLGYPGFWLREPELDVSWKKVLHGEQWLTLHAPLPATGTVKSHSRVLDVVDKGPDKGAIIYSAREITDAQTGAALATVMQSTVCRGDGGSGGPRETAVVPKPQAIPDRAPDETVSLSTRPESALLYRLCGDLNPLHADPAVAAAAGFDRPILHGLASYAVAGHAVLKACCDYDPARLHRFDVRFANPVYPGETLVTELWRLGEGEVAFRCTIAERKTLALNNGYAQVGA